MEKNPFIKIKKDPNIKSNGHSGYMIKSLNKKAETPDIGCSGTGGFSCYEGTMGFSGSSGMSGTSGT